MQSHKKYFENKEVLQFQSEDSDKENMPNFMNLGANDGFPAFMGVLSESDEEQEGKRVRTYSFDPEKFDLSSHNDDIDWKHNLDHSF